METCKSRSVSVKHGLIIYSRTTVPYACIIRIILTGITGCPSGTICLPQIFIFFYPGIIGITFQPGGIPHCDPRRLPVIHSETSGLADRGYDIPDTVRLSLLTELVGSHIVILPHTYCIIMSVRIIQRIGIARLCYHHIFSVLFTHRLELALQILQSTVPVRIIGRCQDIVIHIIILKSFRPVDKLIGSLWICKMDHDPDVFIKISDCFRSGVKQSAHVCIVRSCLTDKTVGCLVSYLHHIDFSSGSRNLFKRIRCKCADRLFFLFQAVIFPCFGRLLFTRICPEIGIMEINKHLQTCIRTAFRNLYRCFHVIITAAVSVSFTVIWIIPHTHTNIGNPAVVFKEFTEIRYIIDHISIEILICHSAVEFRNHRRDVQSHNEIFTEILYLFYIDISLYIPLRIIFPGIRSLSFSYCKRNHRSGQFIAVRLQLSHDIIVPDTRKSHIHLENLSAVVAEHRINQTIFISDCPLIRPPPQVNTFCPKISNLCIPFEYFCRKVNRVSCFRGSIVRRNFNTVHIRSVRFFCHHGKCCHTPDHTQ